jgi:hypothetical protein
MKLDCGMVFAYCPRSLRPWAFTGTEFMSLASASQEQVTCEPGSGDDVLLSGVLTNRAERRAVQRIRSSS